MVKTKVNLDIKNLNQYKINLNKFNFVLANYTTLGPTIPSTKQND